jgi:TonB family protein
VEGGAHASAGRGVRDGARGEDHRDAALVAYGRPMVNQGTPSVPSDLRDRPTDNVDSEQEVAARMQSILHASNAGGAAGQGIGGQAGAGPAGVGGRDGAGSVSRALGTGVGPGVDVDPRDRRRNDYMRQVIAKIGPHTDWRKLMSVAQAADGVQGVVVVTFTILSDGSVAGASITRSSGQADIDENVRRAILKAAPFPPLPPELGSSFRWAFPLDLRNPAVRPRDGGAAPKPSARSEP